MSDDSLPIGSLVLCAVSLGLFCSAGCAVEGPPPAEGPEGGSSDGHGNGDVGEGSPDGPPNNIYDAGKDGADVFIPPPDASFPPDSGDGGDGGGGPVCRDPVCDGGETETDGGDGGPIRNGSDGGDGGDGNDGGTAPRRGINDHFASIPCRKPVDLDVVGGNLLGVCPEKPTQVFQCPIPENPVENSSACETIYTLADPSVDQFAVKFHESLSGGASLFAYRVIDATASMGYVVVDATRQQQHPVLLTRLPYRIAGQEISLYPKDPKGVLFDGTKLWFSVNCDDGQPEAVPLGKLIGVDLEPSGDFDFIGTDASSLSPGPITTLENGVWVLLNYGSNAYNRASSLEWVDPANHASLKTTPVGGQLSEFPEAVFGDNGTRLYAVEEGSSPTIWEMNVSDSDEAPASVTYYTINSRVKSVKVLYEDLFVTTETNGIYDIDLTQGHWGEVKQVIQPGREPGPSEINGGILYQTVSAGPGETPGSNPKIIAIDPTQTN